jgi:hypothetical protein
VAEAKFKILPKVRRFCDAEGVRHLPGEVVDLPASYDGESWLERVDPVPVVAAVPGRVEPVAAEQVAPEVPLEASAGKRTRKKLKS